MRTLFIVTLALSVTQVAIGQIPNFSFEQWDSINGDEIPVDWKLSSDTLGQGGFKDDDAFSGFYSLNLHASGIYYAFATCNFSIGYRPYVLNGWYHLDRWAPYDTLGVRVKLYSNHVLTDSGELLFSDYHISAWSPFSIPITTNSITADSVFIEIICEKDAGPASSNNLWIDYLYFDDHIGILSPPQKPTFKLLPNPTTDYLTFECFSNESTATIFNSHGKQVMQESFSNCNKPTIEVSDFPSGIYFLQIDANNRRWTSKFVKE